MHYRHIYHAGNFADVFKHVLLCGLLLSLNRKQKPWFYVDTHAGAGLYDLGAAGAAATGEWRAGIERIFALKESPEPLATYLRIVREGQRAAQPQPGADAALLYPGSPLIAQALARVQDRIVLCEREVEVAIELKRALHGDKRVNIHLRDGYEAYSLLPPPERRGLVLIDPPFERSDEFQAIQTFLAESLARFAGGIYAMWYPLKNRHAAAHFVRQVSRSAQRPVLNIEFETGAAAQGQMRGCGFVIVNPPYRFDIEVGEALQRLLRELAQSGAAMIRFEATEPD
jgi:23S rRNA (adenine2030-N6)-methyltransferase